MRKVNYSRVAESLQVPFVVLSVYWCLFYPPPGYAVAALAFAAAIMAVRTEHFTRTEQVIWILLAGALCFIEFRAISKDRDEHDQLEASIRWQDEFNRKQERRQFDKLLEHGRTLFAQEKQLTTETLNTITGGPGFCYLKFLSNLPSIPFVTNAGRFPLVGVDARVADLSKPPPLSLESLRQEPILHIGNLAKRGTWLGTSSPVPFTSEEKEDFSIFFSANNGLWNEEIHLRKLPTRWATALRITDGSGKKRLLLCIDKDYPRDFKFPEQWVGTPDPSCSNR